MEDLLIKEYIITHACGVSIKIYKEKFMHHLNGPINKPEHLHWGRTLMNTFMINTGQWD